MLPQYAVVDGVVSGTVGGTNTGTFQTGDTIKGSSNNTLNIVNAATAAQNVSATVSNIQNMNVKNVAAGALTINNILSTNIANATVTQAVGGATTIFTNGSAATVYGNRAGINDVLGITFGSGNTNKTLNLALSGAGSASAGNSAVRFGGTTATDINTVAISLSGVNYVDVSTAAAAGGVSNQANVKTVTVTGDGTGFVGLDNAIATATSTSAVTVDASAATGADIVLGLGAAFNQYDVIKGSTAAGKTWVGAVVTGVQSVPVANWTNIDGIQIGTGSTGTLILTGNTGVSAIRVADTTAGDNTTITNLGQLTSLAFVGNGNQGNHTNGTITLNGASLTGTADTVAITFDNLGQTPASADGWTIGGGALGLNGVETLTINSLGAIGSSGTLAFATGITDTAIKALSVTSVGNVNLGTVTGQATADQGTLLSVDASNVAKALTATFTLNTFGNGAVVTGAVGNNTLNFGADTGVAETIMVTTGAGNDVITVNAASTSSFTINSGNGNDTIKTGAGSDTIVVGSGSNSITVGGGTNSVTLGSHAGNQDTVNITGSATANSISGWVLDTATTNGDILDVTATTLFNVGKTALAANVVFSSGTATQFTVASGLLTFQDAANATLALSAADAALAQAAVQVAANVTKITNTNASAANIVFTAGTSSYVYDYSAAGAVLDVATLVGVTATGLDTAAGTTLGYITLA